jgi:hypothetical protein
MTENEKPPPKDTAGADSSTTSPSSDFPHKPQPRSGVNTDLPEGALTWCNSDKRKECLALWRRAVGARASRFEIKLAWELSESLNWKGSTTIGDTKLMKALGCNLRRVQTGLKALDDMGAIIRVTVMTPNLNRKRTIYFKVDILSQYRSISKRNGLRPPGGRDPYTTPRGAHM